MNILNVNYEYYVLNIKTYYLKYINLESPKLWYDYNDNESITPDKTIFCNY